MSAITVEVLILVGLILLNSVFALAEMAVVSARRARLLERANEGEKGAQAALELVEEPDQFLSTVQVGITLVGILAGAFGGATLSEVLGQQLNAWIAPYGETAAFVLVVMLITYCSLVVGELVPKRLALQNPEGIASRVARPMQRLSRLTFPLVRLLSASTNGVVRLLGVGANAAQAVTEEEIRLMIEEGTEAGVFEATEQDMVESILRLDIRRAAGLMTPHTEIVWLDVDDSVEAVGRKIAESGHSTFPVGRGSLDKLVGVIESKDLLSPVIAGQGLDLEKRVRQPLYVPESAPASAIVELLKQCRMVMVIDEHGGIQGLITEHDLLEAIVGEIPEPGDLPQVVQREDGSWLVDGLLGIDDLLEQIGVERQADDDWGGYQTVGGLVMQQLDRVPSAGDYFSWRGLRIEVVDMDGRRVDKILIKNE
ncbi:MAG TPA: hemolysin family protein [Aggregatilineaceae bacterium]|nr:hemolysin family protein [Aggregatilineaceae bacterium]